MASALPREPGAWLRRASFERCDVLARLAVLVREKGIPPGMRPHAPVAHARAGLYCRLGRRPHALVVTRTPHRAASR